VKYYIIAGEASGDLHASNLMHHLKEQDPLADFRFWGGDLMKAQGGDLVKHYRDLAFMGFTEVLFNIRTIFKNLVFCKQDILKHKPDVLILVDYPGFNLRIAEFAKENGIKVFYYISPQIWAWKQGRVHQIKKIVDRMFVILPFESEFYQKFNYKVDYVGHPLLDAIENFKAKGIAQQGFLQKHDLNEKPVIAVLPGSRKQEISRILKTMLKISPSYPDFQFVIAGAPSISPDYYERFLKGENVKMVHNKTYELLQHSTAALVTSGTATLETALFGVPEVVCYAGNKISYLIAKKLIKVKYISLVNLIMDEPVVKELIQDDFNADQLKQELDKILFDPQVKGSIHQKYSELKMKLGDSGASARTAALMLKYLKEQ
jgi:lipid-A-disaccharide synthase